MNLLSTPIGPVGPIVWEAAIVKCNFPTPKLGPIFFESYSYSDYIKWDPQKRIVENIRFWAISGFGPETPFFVIFCSLFIYGMALNPNFSQGFILKDIRKMFFKCKSDKYPIFPPKFWVKPCFSGPK